MNLLSFLFSYLHRQKRSLLIIAALSLLVFSMLILPYPLIIRKIIDNVLPEHSLTELILYSSLLIFILISKNAIYGLQGILFYRINATMLYQLRIDLLHHVLSLPADKLLQHGTGYFIARIEGDTQELAAVMLDSLLDIIKNMIILLTSLCVMFYLDWQIALLCAALIPCYFLILHYFRLKLQFATNRYLEQNALASQRLEESLRASILGKTFLRTDYLTRRYARSAQKKLYTNIRRGRLFYICILLGNLISDSLPVWIILYGGWQVIGGALSLGTMIALSTLAGYCLAPLMQLCNITCRIQQALSAFQRIQLLLNAPIETTPDSAQNAFYFHSLQWIHISFAYEASPILRDVSFEVLRGERVGIVGPSGNGKSTIFKLLTGLYPISNGRIKINQQPVSTSALIALRQHIAIVEQQPLLLNDTIKNNIRFGKINATLSEVTSAAKQAGIADFIETLPQKYDTVLQPAGANLSLGQLQRLAIARALIRQPQILLLDEITASLDPINEEQIMHTIYHLPDTMTILLIAHHLSNVKLCDKIFVLSNGILAEEGTHTSLLQQQGLYTRLFAQK